MNTTREALRTIARTTDEALLPLYAKEAGLEEAIAEAEKIAADRRYGSAQARYAAKAEELTAELAAVRAELAPLAVIADAGRWTRFVLVPGGHVHRMHCSTLRFTTVRYIMPAYSGATEAELVEDAAEAACTVCFPSAPVDRPTRIPELVAEREAREAEAAAKATQKAAAKAAQITVGRTVYKTLRAAENAISWEMGSLVSRTYMEGVDAEHTAHLRNLAAEDRGTIEAIADAIEAVYPEWDRAAVIAKKFTAKAKEYRKGGWAIPADASY